MDQYPKFLEAIEPAIATGRLRWRETVLEGIERAPQAFLGLFSGENIGKTLVKLA